MGSNEQKIVNTLLYSSIFSFPLTQDELYYYLLTDTPVSKVSLQRTLKSMNNKLVHIDEYITLKEMNESIMERKRNESFVIEKREIAQSIIKYLSWIPTVYFIGISGSVAVGNVKKHDDIDLFVITKTGALFSTRLLLLVMLQLLGKRRKRGNKHVNNSICLNMLIDESSMMQPRDIYTAHEIAQVYPLLNRNNTYKKFLQCNEWIKQYLFHANEGRAIPHLYKKKNNVEKIVMFIEPLAKIMQKLMINRHKTTEFVTSHVLAFHPQDHKQRVIKTFSQLIKQYK